MPRAVASVNGEPITSSQLESAIRPQIEAMEDRIRQVRQAGLNKLIDNLLLEQAARAERITVDEYLQRRVESISVPPAQVDEAYGRSRDQFRGVLAAEAKYRIRRTLEDNARASALNALLESLRRKATVTNHLAMDARAALEASAHEGPSSGPPDAPVTILEFSDFECRFCRAAQPVLHRIMQRWPGRVRLVFKHFPLEQHANAALAARASVCADRQGLFWPMHDRIFAAATSPDEAFLRAAASGAGLRAADFDACMGSDEPLEHVKKDVLIGRMAGVDATPAFFVNGEFAGSAAALESAVQKLVEGGGR